MYRGTLKITIQTEAWFKYVQRTSVNSVNHIRYMIWVEFFSNFLHNNS